MYITVDFQCKGKHQLCRTRLFVVVLAMEGYGDFREVVNSKEIINS